MHLNESLKDQASSYKLFIEAVDRLTTAAKADGTCDADLALLKRDVTATQKAMESVAKCADAVAHRAGEQGAKPLDIPMSQDHTGWLRLADAPAFLAQRLGKCAQHIREALIDALRTAALKHRIAGWNGDKRQWGHMRNAPFSPGEGGSRLPAGCDETIYTIGEDCFFIAKVYSWTSAPIDWEAGTVANFLGHRSPIEIERTALFAWADKAMDALSDVKPFPAALEDQAVADAVGRDAEPTIEPFLQPHTTAPTTLRTAILPKPEATAHLQDGHSVPKRAPATVRDDIARKWLQGWVQKFAELNGRKHFIKEVLPVMQQLGFQERVIRRAHRSLPSALKQPALNPGNRCGHLTADC
ncbi:hypothetical protein [Roseomonas sp. 18066]|uniref:hypothetical protein n=1 Tax=Roseomonas sp. 18066 TaxID=2681412 RepID=UPI001357CDC9|nr:hypothetical protein [Roseomonas sp. 18066]